MGSLHCNVRFSVCLIHEPCLWHGEKRSFTWKRAGRRFRLLTCCWTVSSWASRKALWSSFSEHPLVLWFVCRTVKRRPGEDAAGPVFSNSIRGTPRRLLPEDETREPREPREPPLRIDVRPVHADFPSPINTEPARPRRVYIRNSVELVRYGYTPGSIGCEAAMTQGPSCDHTEQCRTRIIQAMSSTSVLESGKRTKECHVQCLMRNQA